MRKFSYLVIVFLLLCSVSIVLMRSCGGDRRGEPIPTVPPAPAVEEPEVTPEIKEPEVTPVPTPVPTPSYAGSVWTTDGVNLRTGPGTDYDIFNAVDKGTQLQRTGLSENGWSIIDFDGVECYVSSDYITTTPPESGSGESSGSSSFNVTACDDTVWTTDGMNLRRGPGTEYDIAVTVEKDTELRRTGTTDNGWSRVLYENVGYYVLSSYLSTTAPITEEGEETSEEDSESTAAPVVGEFETSGEFSSDTGLPMNLIVRWSVSDNGDGSRTLQLNAYLSSFTIHAASAADDLCFKVGNDTFYVSSKGVDVEAASATETALGSCSARVTSMSVPVTVSWRFNGTYSGQQVDDVIASSTLVFGS